MTIKEIKQLSEKLSQVPNVCRFDSEEEPQCWALAHVLTEFKQCSEKINKDFVPKILEETDNDKIEDLLHDIGEEFRFIVYLIQNSKYYDHLVP